MRSAPSPPWSRPCANQIRKRPREQASSRSDSSMRPGRISHSSRAHVTQTAALAGVEVRFPLLDPALVEFSCQIPASLKMKNLQKRYMFKYALRDFLPQQIIHKTKHGFGLPFAAWLRSEASFRERLRDIFADAELVRRGIIQPGFIPALIARHQADHSSYYGDIVWMVMMLELWFQKEYK